VARESKKSGLTKLREQDEFAFNCWEFAFRVVVHGQEMRGTKSGGKGGG
jgi:hypothetical protein